MTTYKCTCGIDPIEARKNGHWNNCPANNRVVYECDLEWLWRTRELQNEARKWVLVLYPYMVWEYNFRPTFPENFTIRVTG